VQERVQDWLQDRLQDEQDAAGRNEYRELRMIGCMQDEQGITRRIDRRASRICCRTSRIDFRTSSVRCRTGRAGRAG
jgi:hypothetical protein